MTFGIILIQYPHSESQFLVAQLVARTIYKAEVEGSNPAWSFVFISMEITFAQRSLDLIFESPDTLRCVYFVKLDKKRVKRVPWCDHVFTR